MTREVLEFEGKAPETGGEPLPFAVTMYKLDGSGKVRQTFLAKPRGQVSYGGLVDVVSRQDAASVFGAFERMLVDDNSDPQDSDDDRTEFERFREFLGDKQLTIDGETLGKIATALVEEYAEVPTTRPSRSAPTRRPSAGRGSAGRPSRPR